MKHWLSPLLGMFFVLGVLAPVRADALIPPRPVPLPEAKTAKINIVIDERVTEPRFIVPKTLMGAKKNAMLETPTIVAGLALSLAFVSGGVWLVRRGKARAVAAVVLSFAALTLGATALFADIAKPPPPPAPKPLTLPADVTFSGKVQFEFVEKGDDVTLLVKKAWVTSKKADPTPNVKPNEKPTDE